MEMKKINIKLLTCLFTSTVILLIFLFVLYAKNNIKIYIPQKDTVEHLGFFSGVTDDYVTNSLYFTNYDSIKKQYNISPDSDSLEGPIQIYKLTDRNNQKNNNMIFAYFQRDYTTDIDIEIKSVDPSDITVHQAVWFLSDL